MKKFHRFISFINFCNLLIVASLFVPNVGYVFVHCRNLSNSRRNKKKPKNGLHWDPEDMKLAVNDVMINVYGYLKARKMYNVPQTTLEW